MLGELSGLGCAAVWAVVSSAMRAVSERVNLVLLNGVRCGFAAATLALLILLLGHGGGLLTLPASAVAALIASGVLGQASGDALFIRSMKLIGESRAMPISSSYPLLTLGLAVLLLGERVSWSGLAGTILVLGGIYLLAFPRGMGSGQGRLSGSTDRAGVAFALAAACCWSVSIIVLRQGLVESDLLAANFVRLVTAAVMLLGLEAFHSGGRIGSSLSRRSLAILCCTGALNAFSSLMYVVAVYFAGAAKAAVLTSTSPLFGLPLSIVFLRERVTLRVVGGTLLSVLGIWLVLWG